MLDTFTAHGHTAHLEPITGTGFAVLPHADTDVRSPDQGATIHQADRLDFFAALKRQTGFQPTDSEDDNPDQLCIEGATTDGRLVIALSNYSPIADEPTFDMEDRAAAELRDAIGGLLPAPGTHYDHAHNQIVA